MFINCNEYVLPWNNVNLNLKVNGDHHIMFLVKMRQKKTEMTKHSTVLALNSALLRQLQYLIIVIL